MSPSHILNQILIFSFLIYNCVGKNVTNQQIRFQNVLRRVESKIQVPPDFEPLPWSEQHRFTPNVIFAVVLGGGWSPRYCKMFLGTARKAGFTEDIVLAIDQRTTMEFAKRIADYKGIIYNVTLDCVETNDLDRKCLVVGQKQKRVSINMMRYYLYLWWAEKYPKDSVIMISDFRDVIFQTNPFNYLAPQWRPPRAQLIVFLEAIPNKMIYRCQYNSGWIKNCYGDEAFQLVKNNPISCSGISFGSRDGILIYVSMMLDQIEPDTRARYGVNHKVPNSNECISLGMDQGFHNWLLFSGKLQRSMRVKVFYQGEGPVSTLGSYYPGHQALLKFKLDEQWGILKGEKPNRYFANWNGDESPVIHQMDRFEPSLVPNFEEELKVLQGLK